MDAFVVYIPDFTHSKRESLRKRQILRKPVLEYIKVHQSSLIMAFVSSPLLNIPISALPHLSTLLCMIDIGRRPGNRGSKQQISS